MRTDVQALQKIDTVCQLRRLEQERAHAALQERRSVAERAAEQSRHAHAQETANARAQASRLTAGAPVDPLAQRLGLAHAQALQQQSQQARDEHVAAEAAAQLARVQWLQTRLRQEALQEEQQRHRRAWQRQRTRQLERALEDRALPTLPIDASGSLR